MRNEFVDKINALSNSHEAYATAMIVRRKTPSSSKPGDQAVITADGKIHGWIGGGCTRGIVLKEALLAMNDRKPRFVIISKDQSSTELSNTKIYNMSCQSGGEVEVYIEPVLPKPQIIIFGNSHIGMALAKLSKAMDYKVEVVQTSIDKNVYPSADNIYSIDNFEINEVHKQSYAVVCTQGEGDLAALSTALKMESQYLAFVSSPMKAQSIYTDLRKQEGATFDQLTKIKCPAGLDLGAKLPEEVAISILAEVIKKFRLDYEKEKTGKEAVLDIPNDDFYMNPVCNIPIQKSTAKHVLEHAGQKVYFCCDGCKVSFEKEPSKYIVV
jgi:xanthine dehydrogenase accessory factor